MAAASCLLCFQPFVSVLCVPKLLGCGHSVCAQCVEKFEFITCPKDDQLFETKGKKPLLVNFSLLEFISDTSSEVDPPLLPNGLCHACFRVSFKICLLFLEAISHSCRLPPHTFVSSAIQTCARNAIS